MSNSQIALVSPPPNAAEISGTQIALPAWFTPIPGSQWFDAVGLVDVPANGAGNAVTVVSQTVPSGYTGIVKKIANEALYGGFVDGSGWLIWQIYVDSNTVMNYQDITAQLGAIDNPSDTFVEVASGSTVSWVIQSAMQPPPSGAQTLCRLSGWYWPSAMESST